LSASLVLTRRALLAGLSLPLLSVPARSASLPEPERIPVELVEDVLALPSAIRLGHPHGDVIMIEFFDYNCPWCKRSAGELAALLDAEPDLAYVLMNYPVLGPASVEAARVALGSLQLRGKPDYVAFHLALFGLRGPVDGQRALATARDLGLDEARLTELATGAPTTRVLDETLRLGASLGLTATPSFVLSPQAYEGGMTLAQKRAAIAEARG
jgi:protein-disulfide isomerase